MKKQYIKPESTVVVVKLLGSVLGGIGMRGDSFATTTVDSRSVDFSDEEEESTKPSIWK